MEQIITTISGLGYWNWFIAAAVLMMLETVVPGVHFLWFGMAAVVTGFLTALLGIGWQWQVIAFGILAVVTFFTVRQYATPQNAKSDRPDLNIRGQQYVGRKLVLEQAIVDGRGRVRVGDSLWSAQGPDLPAGATVTVTGTNGTVLIVEAA